MITHFYSDPHFGHANIIKYTSRPFADVEEMDVELVRRYAAVVGKDDFVLWLGDCGWSLSTLETVLAKLPGRKGLVLGNHDGKPKQMVALGFEFVTERMWLDLNGVPALVCHYPPVGSAYGGSEFDSRYENLQPKLGKGQICLHGHTHERVKVVQGQPRVHVGVDAWDFAPASIAEVSALARGVVR